MKKIQKAVTDFDGQVTYEPETRPGVSNLVSIYAAMSGLSHKEVCQQYEGKETVDFKAGLAELLVEKLAPIHAEMKRLEADPGYVDGVLEDGARRAREIAQGNLKQVQQQMGLC